MKNILFLTVLSLLVSCVTDTREKNETVSASKFCEGLSDPSVQLIDVRTPVEFNEGHIQNATLINIQNEQQFLSKLNTLDKQKPVYVYCRSGNRSALAAGHLANNEFEKIVNLEGGFVAWQEQETDCPLFDAEKVNH